MRAALSRGRRTGGGRRRGQERCHVDAVNGLRRPLAAAAGRRMATGAGREAGRMGADRVTLRWRRCGRHQQVGGASGGAAGWRRTRLRVDGFAEDAVGDGDDR